MVFAHHARDANGMGRTGNDRLRDARRRGLMTIDGVSMLIGQAALAFQLFFGAWPPRARDAELRQLLTS